MWPAGARSLAPGPSLGEVPEPVYLASEGTPGEGLYNKEDSSLFMTVLRPFSVCDSGVYLVWRPRDKLARNCGK